MIEISCLLDYRGNYWTRHYEDTYRSGFLLTKLQKEFEKVGIKISFLKFAEIKNFNEYKGRFVIYTSIEDHDLFYKSFVEDIILGLELAGAVVIPSFIYLKAHHNKVFMEILRKIILQRDELDTEFFGAFEDLVHLQNLQFPKVLKSSAGATGKSVFLVDGISTLKKNVKQISSSPNISSLIKENIRKIKYPGYKKESFNRKKYIIQKYIDNLTGDFKILIFGKKYFVLWRNNRKNDFRASGSGNFEFRKELPTGLLDFARAEFDKMEIPHASLDIGIVDSTYFILEFQVVTFGTYTLEASDFHFEWDGSNWNTIETTVDLEQIYTESIKSYLEDYGKRNK